MEMEAPPDGLLPAIIPKADTTWQLEYSVRKDNRVKRRPQVSLTNLTDFFIMVSVLSAKGIGFSKGWFLRRNKIGNCDKKSLPGQGWNRQNRQVRDSYKRCRIERTTFNFLLFFFEKHLGGWMVQNIHPLGINTRLFPLFVLRWIVRPPRFLMPVSGRDISASSEFRSSPSSVLVEFCASATRSQRMR